MSRVRGRHSAAHEAIEGALLCGQETGTYAVVDISFFAELGAYKVLDEPNRELPRKLK